MIVFSTVLTHVTQQQHGISSTTLGASSILILIEHCRCVIIITTLFDFLRRSASIIPNPSNAGLLRKSVEDGPRWNLSPHHQHLDYRLVQILCCFHSLQNQTAKVKSLFRASPISASRSEFFSPQFLPSIRRHGCRNSAWFPHHQSNPNICRRWCRFRRRLPQCPGWSLVRDIHAVCWSYMANIRGG